MLVKFTNAQIYELLNKLDKAFTEDNIYFPVRFNYYFVRNASKLEEQVKNIDLARNVIINHYATVKGDKYQFSSQEDLDKANKEINELFTLEQELQIDMVDLAIIEEMQLTVDQMEAIMLMIKE